jgi:uncharacterized membrane protein YkvA (DUF1232 family)
MPIRREEKSRMKELLMFLPNLGMLLVGLLRDARVSSYDKAILAGVLIYLVSPLDVIPDLIPFVGQVDDAYLVAISILRLMNRADRRVVLEHWKGDLDIKELVANIAQAASFFLPKPIKNALVGKVERLPSKSELHTPDPHLLQQ